MDVKGESFTNIPSSQMNKNVFVLNRYVFLQNFCTNDDSLIKDIRSSHVS